MKTYFAMVSGVVISRHYSKNSARKSILKAISLCERVPVDCYYIAQLKSPQKWEKYDHPHQQYVLNKEQFIDILKDVKEGSHGIQELYPNPYICEHCNTNMQSVRPGKLQCPKCG